MSETRTEGSSLCKKFAAARAVLCEALIERDDEIDLALTALVARESLLLVGPPGTAKSMLCQAIGAWMNARRFEYLLTKFTTPEELFGPISVAGLKADDYRRITAGKLPEAETVFLDEIFKASSAILNTLLRVLNEKKFQNGREELSVPLRLCLAASNEWPNPETGQELGALFDRFLIRKTVKPVASTEGRRKLWWRRNHLPVFAEPLAPTEIDQAACEAQALPWTETAQASYEKINADLRHAGVIPGDRRSYKAVAIAQAAAWLDGASEVSPVYLAPLAHVLWDDPVEQPQVTARIVLKHACPGDVKLNELVMQAASVGEGIDRRDIGQVTTAVRKLQDIAEQLLGLGPNPRAAKALTRLSAQIRELKLAALDAA